MDTISALKENEFLIKTFLCNSFGANPGQVSFEIDKELKELRYNNTFVASRNGRLKLNEEYYKTFFQKKLDLLKKAIEKNAFLKKFADVLVPELQYQYSRVYTSKVRLVFTLKIQNTLHLAAEINQFGILNIFMKLPVR